MTKGKVLIAAALLLSGCATAETTLSREPMVERYAGQREDLATCVYDELTKADYPDLQLIDYRRQNTTRVFQGGPGSSVRFYDIAFVQEAPETVRTEIRGAPTVWGDQFWENKVLPLVQSCAKS